MGQVRKKVRQAIRLIWEAKQHTDDEIVDFDEIDLQDEYNKLNSLLFQGNLQPVQMIWNTRRSSHGVVKATRNRLTGQITIKSLGISKFLDVPYSVFKDTLAHEMIHVNLLQQGINDGHGFRFIREMNRINSMGLGFNVTVTTDSSNFGLSKHAVAKAKELVFYLLENNLNSNLLVVVTPNTYRTEGHKLEKLYGRLVVSGKFKWVKCEIYKSSDPNLLKYTQNRNFNSSVSYVPLSQDVADQLKSNAEKIDSFEIKKDENFKAQKYF
jgi:hypothetical protein